MGWIRGTGRFVAREASYLVGAQLVGFGWRAVRTNWQRVTKRPCPKCGLSVLFPFSEMYEGKAIEALGCGRCDYFEFIATPGDQESLGRAREATEQALKDSQMCGARLLHYQRTSRVYFALSLVCLFASFAMMLCGKSIFLAVAMVGVLVLLRGLVASYRYWQLHENRLFVPGSFKVWMKSGAWFV